MHLRLRPAELSSEFMKGKCALSAQALWRWRKPTCLVFHARCITDSLRNQIRSHSKRRCGALSSRRDEPVAHQHQIGWKFCKRRTAAVLRGYLWFEQLGTCWKNVRWVWITSVQLCVNKKCWIFLAEQNHFERKSWNIFVLLELSCVCFAECNFVFIVAGVFRLVQGEFNANLEVMPLSGGFLPLPSVKLHKCKSTSGQLRPSNVRL